MIEEQDNNDPIKTALREAHEEVGLNINSVDVWATIAPFELKPRHLVYVVVGFCGHLLEETEINSSPNTSSHDLIPSDTAQCLSPSPKEVEAIFFRSLDWLCSPGTLSYTEFRMARYRNPFVISDQPAHSLTKVSPSSSSYPHYSDDYRYLIPAFGQTVQTLDWPRIWGITAMILNRVLLCLLPSSITLHYPPGIYSRLIPTSRPIGLPIDHTYQKT